MSALVSVARRFPLAMLSAAVGVGAAISLVEMARGGEAAKWDAARILVSAVIALPLAVSISLVAESRAWTKGRSVLAMVLGLLGVIAYFLSLPSSVESVHEALFIRTVVIALGLHFVVSTAPFLRGGEEGAIWSFNWALFIRFCTGALYSAVIFGGLAIAMVSASQLFGLKIKEERYFELWLVITGLFNTCFFLHGVPREFSGVSSDYPRGLRVFAQFALAPLVVVYLAILYPYAAKIAIVRQWPDGWVALPVLCLAVGGTLAALFLDPIRERETWAAWYWRWFYRALLPLSALLFLALKVRVGDYGITEPRYFGLVLAVWMAGTCIHLILPGVRTIRWLPASLAVICLLTTWGPWGAFGWSERSQFNRLVATLDAKGFIKDGTLTPNPQTLEAAEHKNLTSMVRYLRNHHDSKRLDRLLAPLPVRTDSASKRSSMQGAQNEAEQMMNWLGVSALEESMRGFAVKLNHVPVPTDGWPMVRLWQGTGNLRRPGPEADGKPFTLEIDAKGTLVAVAPSGRTELRGMSEIIRRTVENPSRGDPVTLEEVSSIETVDATEYLFVLRNLEGTVRTGGAPNISQLTLLIFSR